MPDKQTEKKTWTSYFTKKVITTISAVAAVFTLVGAIWGFEAHYATNKRVDGVEIVHADDIAGLEIKLAGALENTQYKSDVRFFQFMYNKLGEDLIELRRQMRRYPEDELLKEDYRVVQQKRLDIEKQLDEALKKIKVN
jgi:hypothetical protein